MPCSPQFTLASKAMEHSKKHRGATIRRPRHCFLMRTAHETTNKIALPSTMLGPLNGSARRRSQAPHHGTGEALMPVSRNCRKLLVACQCSVGSGARTLKLPSCILPVMNNCTSEARATSRSQAGGQTWVPAPGSNKSEYKHPHARKLAAVFGSSASS